MVPDPSESFVLAIPSALVVLCTGFTAPEPSPDVTAHITTTPRTGRPLRSSTVTLNGVGSGLLKYQFWPSPPLGTTSEAGPAGCVSFLHPDAQSAATSNHGTHCRPVIGYSRANRAESTRPVSVHHRHAP